MTTQTRSLSLYDTTCTNSLGVCEDVSSQTYEYDLDIYTDHELIHTFYMWDSDKIVRPNML